MCIRNCDHVSVGKRLVLSEYAYLMLQSRKEVRIYSEKIGSRIRKLKHVTPKMSKDKQNWTHGLLVLKVVEVNWI